MCYDKKGQIRFKENYYFCKVLAARVDSDTILSGKKKESWTTFKNLHPPDSYHFGKCFLNNGTGDHFTAENTFEVFFFFAAQ